MDRFKKLVNQFKNITFLDSDDDKKTYGTDWTKVYKPMPMGICFPKNHEEVCEVLAYCNENNIAVVPSGGRTGLAGACVSTNDELVLSLDKMNKIQGIDLIGQTITAEAGCITEVVQQYAKDHDRFFALDLAAKGSCQVGGNVATNAGGLKFIKYGGAREQVAGLKVALMNGETLDFTNPVKKDNSGYELKQLFIGSEGTLGVITEVTFKVYPKPTGYDLCLLATTDSVSISNILQELGNLGVEPSAFEFISQDAFNVVLKNHKNLRDPFEKKYDTYLLLELESESDQSVSVLESCLERLFETGYVVDGVVAGNSSEFNDFWALRELISESVTTYEHLKKNDVSVAVKDLSDFIGELVKINTNSSNNLNIVLFGHIGDGNIHINYCGNKELTTDTFKEKVEAIESQVFEIIKKYKGSISAEHGIGLLKKESLRMFKSDFEIGLMRQIKSVFDPKGLLNPGKIFD